MKEYNVGYIYILVAACLILSFVPEGIIYSFSNSNRIFAIIYVMQFVVFMLTILECINITHEIEFNSFLTSPLTYIIIWSFILLISTYINFSSVTYVFKAFVYILGIVAFYSIISIMYKTDDSNIFRIIYVIMSIFFLTNTISVFIFPNGLFDNDWRGIMYLFGGKFTTFYLYYTWLALHAIRLKDELYPEIFFWLIFGVVLCLKIEISTGVLCVLITIILVVFKKFIWLIKPIVLVFINAFIAIALLFSKGIFNNSFVQFVVVNILHRDLTFTGRIDIYQAFLQIIWKYRWIGAGFNNTIIKDNTERGYFNAQNGLLDVATKTGIIGTVIFLVLIYFAWRKASKYFKNSHNKILAVMVLGFFTCAIVEISFNYYFFILLFLLQGDIRRMSRENKVEFTGIKKIDIRW